MAGPEISAIVCTRNRSGMLDRAIGSLANQSLPCERYEVVVVDNGSTDDTPELLRKWASRLPCLRYAEERRLGLSQARNTGLDISTAPIVAFLDDDAVACSGWLEGIARAFASRSPQPGLVCGPVNADWGAPRPSWLADYWLPFYSVIQWSDAPRCLASDEWVVGANFALLKSVAIECGGFDTELGRKGRALLSDEEAALTDRVRAAGYDIFYDPDIPVDHHIHAARLTKYWFYRRVFWGAVSDRVRNGAGSSNWRERLRSARSAAAIVATRLWSTEQFRESEAERMLRYHKVAEQLGELRACLLGSARFL